MNDIDDIIMGGMVFKAGGGPKKEDDGKVKTKDVPSSRKPSPYRSYQHKIIIYIREILFDTSLQQTLDFRKRFLFHVTVLVSYCKEVMY